MAAIPAGKCGNITCADGYSLLPVTGQLEWAGPVCRPRPTPAAGCVVTAPDELTPCDPDTCQSHRRRRYETLV